MQKLVCCVGLIVLLLAGGIQPAFADSKDRIVIYQGDIPFIVDGQSFVPPQGQDAFIYRGSTYVPLRFLASTLNKKVIWNGEQKAVTVRDPREGEQVDTQQYQQNNQPSADSTKDLVRTSIDVYFVAITYHFNGEVVQPPDELPGMILANTLYVPVRFLASALDQKIVWHADTRTITAESANPNRGKNESDVPRDELSDEHDEVALDPENPENPENPDNPENPENPGSPGIPALPTSPVPPANPTGPSSPSMTQADIVSEVDLALAQLKNYCANKLIGYYNEYSKTKDATLIRQGWDTVNDCDQQFDQLMETFSQKLQQHGYATTIVQTYRQAYADLKQKEMDALLNRLS